jgi:hypothetical protein
MPDESRPVVVKTPHPSLLLHTFRASVLVWLLARVAYVLVIMVGADAFGFVAAEQAMAAAMNPVWPSRLLLVAITVVLVHIDRMRAHEPLLQANLGGPGTWFLATSFLAAGMTDLAVQQLMPTS